MKLATPLYLSLLLLATAACTQAPSLNEVKQAVSVQTTVYTNADVLTLDEQQPNATAVAVRDGLILAVGSEEAALLAAGPNATVENLNGAALLPGFIDAHGHITFTAFNLASANVSSPPVGKANTIADVIQLLREFKDANPKATWITGWGYDDSLLAEKRHPTREDLDKVSTELPIMLRHVSGHLMACNSQCLKVSGLTAESEDPEGGVIRRMPNSREPNGVLEETAMTATYGSIPVPSKQQRLEQLVPTQKFYASYGLTTVQDGAAGLDEINLVREAAELGKLYLDVVAYPYAMHVGDRLAEVPPSAQYQNNFRVGGIKLVLDGSPQGKTAWLTKPYLHPPHGLAEDYAGYATMSDEIVAGHIDYAFKNNVQVMAHANGDAAADQLIRVVKDGIEKYGESDRRTVMIHAQTAREDQIDAMIQLDIMPSYFSAHTFYWGDWHRDSVFGVERASRISPLRSSADKGLRYTTHNDTPIVPPDMMRLLWASVNRVTRSGKVLGEQQRATVMEALKSITIDAAYQYGEEDSKGSITVGKRADLVVLNKNPTKVPAIEIKDIKVLQTIKDGSAVFSLDSQ